MASNEVLSFEEYRAQAEEAWEQKRSDEIDAAARRLQRADQDRVQMREAEARRVEQDWAQYEQKLAYAAEAHAQLWPHLAEKIDAAKTFTLLHLASRYVVGYLAFSDPAQVEATRDLCRRSALYIDPEGGTPSVSGIHLGQHVGPGELLAVDPTPAEISRLGQKEADAAKERQQHEAEIRQREREDAEAERLRREFGAPVG
jgi:hypothetical protein